MGVKFSNTNPPPPGGKSLVSFQKDPVTGEVSAAYTSGGGGGGGTVTNTGTLNSGQLIKGNGGVDVTVGDLSGDVATSGGTATTIQPNAVTTGKINAAAVTEAKIGLTNVTTNDVSISKHGFAPILPNDATKFLDGTGAYSTPPSGTGTVTHTPGALTSGQLIQGNGGGDIKVADLTGDVSTSGALATTLAATAVTPGSYTNTNLTVDSKGRITAASNGTGGGGTVKYAADNTSLSGWTTGGTGTTPTAVTTGIGAPTPVYKIPNNSFIQRDLSGVLSGGVFNGATIEFDAAVISPTTALWDILFGMDVSGNGGVCLRLDDRGNGAGQQMGFGATSSAFKQTGTVDSTNIFVTSNTVFSSQYHHFKIVIAANGLTAAWYWNGAAQQTARAITMAGGRIGFYGEAGTNGCYIQNLTVTQ